MSIYTIVLVCVGNFQEYIITNLEFLIRLQHKKIVVITEKRFFELFRPNLPEFSGKFPESVVTLIDISELPEPFGYTQKTRLDSVFRNGFWVHTSSRIYYLHAFMKKYDVENVIHIENDVMLFYNADLLHPYLSSQSLSESIFIPFDCYKRNIASIVYIPNHSVLEKALSNFSLQKNDMENFILVANKFPGLIESFPISVLGLETGAEMDFVCKNYHKFGGYIFDAAAIGQYLGGVDPRNIPGDSMGFVNETCVVKYNYYHFNWKLIDGVFRPFMIISNPNVCDSGQLEVPIFNLHIHCKDLKSFIL